MIKTLRFNFEDWPPMDQDIDSIERFKDLNKKLLSSSGQPMCISLRTSNGAPEWLEEEVRLFYTAFKLIGITMLSNKPSSQFILSQTIAVQMDEDQ